MKKEISIEVNIKANFHIPRQCREVYEIVEEAQDRIIAFFEAENKKDGSSLASFSSQHLRNVITVQKYSPLDHKLVDSQINTPGDGI